MSATRGPRCPKSASWPPGPLQTAEGAAGCTDAQLEALQPNWINSKGESLWKGSCWIRWPETPEWKGKPLTTPNAGSLRLASPSAVKQAWLLCKWCVDTKEETHSKARLSLQLHVRCGRWRPSGKWSHRFTHYQSQRALSIHLLFSGPNTVTEANIKFDDRCIPCGFWLMGPTKGITTKCTAWSWIGF